MISIVVLRGGAQGRKSRQLWPREALPYYIAIGLERISGQCLNKNIAAPFGRWMWP